MQTCLSVAKFKFWENCFSENRAKNFSLFERSRTDIMAAYFAGIICKRGIFNCCPVFYESERKVKIILTCQILLLHNHVQAYKKKLRNTGFICYLNRVILKDVISFAKRNPKIVQNHSVLVTGKLHYKTVIRKVITLSFLLF